MWQIDWNSYKNEIRGTCQEADKIVGLTWHWFGPAFLLEVDFGLGDALNEEGPEMLFGLSSQAGREEFSWDGGLAGLWGHRRKRGPGRESKVSFGMASVWDAQEPGVLEYNRQGLDLYLQDKNSNANTNWIFKICLYVYSSLWVSVWFGNFQWLSMQLRKAQFFSCIFLYIKNQRGPRKVFF